MSNQRSVRNRLSSLLSPRRGAGKGGAFQFSSTPGSKKVVVAFSGINPSDDAKKVRLFHVGKKDPSYLHIELPTYLILSYPTLLCSSS